MLRLPGAMDTSDDDMDGSPAKRPRISPPWVTNGSPVSPAHIELDHDSHMNSEENNEEHVYTTTDDSYFFWTSDNVWQWVEDYDSRCGWWSETTGWWEEEEQEWWEEEEQE
jgi:hypothetical protein